MIQGINNDEEFYYILIRHFIFNLVYVDMGTQASESVSLSFDFTGTYSRFFEVKVTQLPCSSEYK